jgi:acyl phosphate:glycerol-3-phosphate acyltransferase
VTMALQGIIGMVVAYLIGGIPVGYLVARARGLDIRTVGSGNIGASNVQRVLGLKAGLAVWVIDVFKGFLPTWAALTAVPALSCTWWPGAIGFAAVVGHCVSPYLGFKGGRGVSTILGIAFALCWPAALIGFGMWVLLVALTRYISLASIIASVVASSLMPAFGAPPEYWCLAVAAALLVTWRHTPNIRRLLAGTETKIGQRARHGEAGGPGADD